MQLYEKYRPTTFDDVVGQSKIVDTINRIRPRGLGGRAFWITGQSGTGKTTIARLLSAEIADDFCVEEWDAIDLTPARIGDLEQSLHIRGLGRGGRAVIVNEAHGLNDRAVNKLLVALERIPPHVIWCFTTTCDGQDKLFAGLDFHPLLSRCVELPLARMGLADHFAARCKAIAEAEGLDGRPIKDYKRLAQDCRNNFRAMLQSVESGSMMS